MLVSIIVIVCDWNGNIFFQLTILQWTIYNLPRDVLTMLVNIIVIVCDWNGNIFFQL